MRWIWFRETSLLTTLSRHEALGSVFYGAVRGLSGVKKYWHLI